MGPILTYLASLFRPDERFIVHRYRSTRAAMIVGVVLMAGWIEYELFANDRIRWDLLIILTAMLVTKVGVMIYMRRTH